MNRTGWKIVVFALLLVLAGGSGIRSVFKSSLRAPAQTAAPLRPAMTNSSLDLDYFSKRPIGKPVEGAPWITDLLVVDLDGDGLKDVVVCDGRVNRVSWIRQVRVGVFEEQDIGDAVAGPVHVEVADLNGDGRLDVLVAAMGVVPPSNAKTGAVVVLVNDGSDHFTNRVLLENVARVTYVAAADFNKDGRPDLIVGQFGYL